jgi:tetratricopeptide (TPR) repeat protein
MPAHTYIRIGDYQGSIKANRAAVTADSIYVASGGIGFYGQMYYSHNMHFLAVSCAFAGRFEEAMQITKRMEDHIYPFAYDPMIGGILPTRYFILTKFQKWDEILETSIPDSGLATMEVFRHFASGMAHAAKGDIKSANASNAAFEDAEARLPENCLIGAINDARRATEIARHMLRAKIAQAEGKSEAAIGHLRYAVAAQDTLSYDEPEGWYINARESLGALLMEGGKHADAEKVFREELTVHPNSGRALYGLWESLKAQKRDGEAAEVRAQFDEAWQIADTKLALNDL